MREAPRRPVAQEPTWPVGRHIPHFFVVSSSGEGASTAATTGAHRFPGAPSPVLASSVSLFGHASVTASCTPWRRGGHAYRFRRVRADDPSGTDVRDLSSARLPKV